VRQFASFRLLLQTRNSSLTLYGVLTPSAQILCAFGFDG